MAIPLLVLALFLAVWRATGHPLLCFQSLHASLLLSAGWVARHRIVSVVRSV